MIPHWSPRFPGYLKSFFHFFENFFASLARLWRPAATFECLNFSHIKNDRVLYRHIAVTPVLVAPGQANAIPLAQFGSQTRGSQGRVPRHFGFGGDGFVDDVADQCRPALCFPQLLN